LLFIFTILFLVKANKTESQFWTANYFRTKFHPSVSKPVIQESDIYSFMNNELKSVFYSNDLPATSIPNRLPSFDNTSTFMLEPRMNESRLVG
jgi:hypothetical protein